MLRGSGRENGKEVIKDKITRSPFFFYSVISITKLAWNWRSSCLCLHHHS
jgi:hypothetical protein